MPSKQRQGWNGEKLERPGSLQKQGKPSPQRCPPEKGRGPGDGGHPSLPLLHHPVSSPEKEVTLWAKQLKVRQAKTWNPCRGACAWTNTKYSNKIQSNYKRPNNRTHVGQSAAKTQEDPEPSCHFPGAGAKAGSMQHSSISTQSNRHICYSFLQSSNSKSDTDSNISKNIKKRQHSSEPLFFFTN